MEDKFICMEKIDRSFDSEYMMNLLNILGIIELMHKTHTHHFSSHFQVNVS